MSLKSRKISQLLLIYKRCKFNHKSNTTGDCPMLSFSVDAHILFRKESSIQQQYGIVKTKCVFFRRSVKLISRKLALHAASSTETTSYFCAMLYYYSKALEIVNKWTKHRENYCSVHEKVFTAPPYIFIWHRVICIDFLLTDEPYGLATPKLMMT